MTLDTDLEKLMDYPECFRKCFVYHETDRSYLDGKKFIINNSYYLVSCNTKFRCYYVVSFTEKGHVCYAFEVQIEDVYDLLIKTMEYVPQSVLYFDDEHYTIDDLRNDGLTKAIR